MKARTMRCRSVCGHCGAEYFSYQPTQKYCSRACYHKSMRHDKQRDCEVAGCSRAHYCRGRCKPHWQELEPKKTLAESFEDHWREVPETGCWEWQRTRAGAGGYGHMTINKRIVLAHRFSWERKNGPIPEGMCVCHKCDNPPCVNPDHLFLGTHADNARDRENKGRRRDLKGSERHNAKLTDVDIRRMRRLYKAGGISQRALAAKFGVTQVTARRAIIGQTWSHIQ